jgi:ABC-type lipoprotein export system ATPase subunit
MKMLATLDGGFGETLQRQRRAAWPPCEKPGAARGATLSAVGVDIGVTTQVFHGLDWHVRPGMQVAVTGGAGSGKTTLLYALAGVVRIQSGAILWNGMDPRELQHHQREAWRRRTLGCLFRTAGLFPAFDALHNVMLPGTFGNWGASASQRSLAEGLLDRAGVRPRARVGELTGAERARVAIVRAIWPRPLAVLADEPIAHLEHRAAETTRRFLQQVCCESGATLIVATRNRDLAETFEHTYVIRSGKVSRFVR